MNRQNLNEAHLMQLVRSSGISKEVLEIAEVQSVTAAEAEQLLGFRHRGLLIPYFTLDNNFHYIGGRLRLDEPFNDVKYLQAPGTSLSCYFLKPSVSAILDPTTTLYIVEGEKKLLSFLSHFSGADYSAAVAFPGCWNWKNRETDDLAEPWLKIPLKGRTAVVLPNSDYFFNQNVFTAINHFCRRLISRGAMVQLIDIRGLSESL